MSLATMLDVAKWRYRQKEGIMDNMNVQYRRIHA